MGSTYFFDDDCEIIERQIKQISALFDVRMPQRKSVAFTTDTTDDIVAVTPYSERYHNHPDFILATSTGWKPNPSRSDFFTGKSSLVMKARRSAIRPLLNSRTARAHRKKVILRANEEHAIEREALKALAIAMQSTSHGALVHLPSGDNERIANAQSHGVLTNMANVHKQSPKHQPESHFGSDDMDVDCPGMMSDDDDTDAEMVGAVKSADPLGRDNAMKSANPRGTVEKSVNAPMMAAAKRTKPINSNKYKKRLGAKQTKKLEMSDDANGNLSPQDAAMYRALSARCNYLAQDRPDISFASKELCREFAVPPVNSFKKLKRLARYLAGMPRLVYEFKWQNMPDAHDCFVDTDFAW